MIYLSFYSSNPDKSCYFYVNKLGIFEEIISTRIKCVIHDDLIIDLDNEKGIGSVASIMMKVDQSAKELHQRFEGNGVTSKYEYNHVGGHVEVIDFDGNKITIHGSE